MKNFFFTFNIECSVMLTIYAFDSVELGRNTRLTLIQNHKTIIKPCCFLKCSNTQLKEAEI